MAQTLGPYTLGQPLGTLPFGELIEATHAARREPIALLILADELAREYRLRGLLRLEIARAGGLRHPAIARPIEVAEHDGRLYVVFERPAGEPLSRWIDDQQGLTLEAVAPMVRSLADGLDAAHGRRLAHGSIRPGVLVARPDGGLVLLGVGVLAAIDEAGLVDACRARLDAAFAAPEQQSGRLAVQSADAFALGRLARTLVSATGEFRAGQIPPGIQAALDRQASAEPASRFRTCAELARALAESLAPPSSASPGAAPSPRPAASPSIAMPPPRTPPSMPRPQPSSEPSRPAERPRSDEVAPAEAQPVSAASPQAAPKNRLPPSEGEWHQEGRSRVRTLSATPSRCDAVHAALPDALLHLTLVSAGPFLLLLFSLIFRATLLFILAIAGLVVLQVPPAIQRAVRLRRAQSHPDFVQALGRSASSRDIHSASFRTRRCTASRSARSNP